MDRVLLAIATLVTLLAALFLIVALVSALRERRRDVALLRALGADPNQVIPKSKWPDDVFGWLIQLRYDSAGNLIEAKRINEHLLPDD